MTNFLEVKKAVASYGGHPAASTTRYTPANYIIDSVDLLALAINDTRRLFEKLWDFKWCQASGLLSIAAAGGNIGTVTELDGSTGMVIKRILAVSLPIAGSGYYPIELSTQDNFDRRIRAQAGMQPYIPTNSLDDYGIGLTSPVAVQQGQTIFLQPLAMFSFPVVAKLSVVRFMPDYSADADRDFFLDVAAEAIKWQAIVELNKLTKNYGVFPAEGNVKEPMDLAQMAFEALVRWDMSLDGGTTTPGDIPQIPRPPQSVPDEQQQ